MGDSDYQSSVDAFPIDRQESDMSEMSGFSESAPQNLYSNIDANYDPSDASSQVDGPDMEVYNADNTKADEERTLMEENEGGKYRKTRRRKNKSTKKRKGKSKKSRKYRRKTKRH